MEPRTFEDYLKDATTVSVIDFMMRATIMDTHTEFYVYPAGKDGKTIRFKVEGNQLIFLDETGEFKQEQELS